MPKKKHNNNFNQLTYAEYQYMSHFGYLPRSREEEEAMNKEIELEEELATFAARNPFTGMVNTGAQSREEAEQVSKFKRITKKNEHGESLKQQIRSFAQSPEMIRRRLALQGLTENTATPNQLFAIVNSLEEGGPVTEGVGTGAIPTRRTNRNVRRTFRVFTEKNRKPESARRNIYRKANAVLNESYYLINRQREIEKELSALRGLARRRKTRRGGRR